MFDDPDCEHNDKKILGYCAYNKTPIHEGDDVVRYRGELYLKENFIQSQLDGHGNVIDINEE